MIYYIDTSEIFFDDCSAYFINSKNDEFITCGKITTPIVDEDDSNFINTAKEKYGINFFIDERDCSTEIYAVPYINIFASDKNGIYAVVNDFPDIESKKLICYIDKHTLKAYNLKYTLSNFITAISNGTLKKQLYTPLTDEHITVFQNKLEAQNHIKISKIKDLENL